MNLELAAAIEAIERAIAIVRWEAARAGLLAEEERRADSTEGAREALAAVPDPIPLAHPGLPLLRRRAG